MPVHEGHRSRKKEQFRAHGLDAFADHEVLELLLYYAVPRQDTNPIAHRLMQKFGSLDAVFAADRAALEEVEGVGENASTLLTLIFPLMRRIRASAGAHEYRLTLYRNQEDVSFAQALRAVSRWWEEACGLTPSPVPPEAKQAMYSSWYSFHQATVAGEIEAECAEAAALGMGSVIVDDGWQTEDGSRGYAYCGDWQVAEGKIPDMAAHVARVHALGMKYLLWYSVPFMGYRSKGFPAFADKLLCTGCRPACWTPAIRRCGGT